MKVSTTLHFEIVDTPVLLDAAVEAMAASNAIAIDTESNSLHHYPEQLCVIQVATPRKTYVIDPLSLNDLGPVSTVLSNPSITKVIHGADYDVRSLDRHYGFRVQNLYDTGVAARFTGATRFGLAALVQDLTGTAMTKSKKLQLTDWGQRPLSPAALDYAVNDVVHLFALHRILAERLQSLGRTAWVAEECCRLEGVRHTVPDLEAAYLSIKGAERLSPRNLAVLRSLYLFREEEARRRHRPPFFIIPDTALVFFAANPTVTSLDVPGLAAANLQRVGRGILQAMREGLAASPVYRPPALPYVRPARDQIERLGALKEWRASLGASLSLDPPLLWPAASLERLARSPGSYDVEVASPDVRQWQREEFAPSLLACLERLPRY